MPAYYNEFDHFAADWLRNLIAAGLIAPGDVDERSIKDVAPSDLIGYEQCHFFAGIGGWSYALRLAHWPDDKPAWTGSCPCQPFSNAGKRKGTADDRHLWPWFERLIAECEPTVVFGEQVASKDGRGWLTGVRADLEALGYAVGAADLCAASAGAPHIRQRLYWVADADAERHDGGGSRGAGRDEFTDSGDDGGVADANQGQRRWLTDGEGCERDREAAGRIEGDRELERGGAVGGVVNANSAETERLGCERLPVEPEQEAGRSGSANAWAKSEIIGCADGKSRRIEPGTFPLAHGAPNRLGRLRGYGNAIVPQVAAEFIRAYMSCRP